MNRWTIDEVDFLMKNFSDMSDIDISKHLNKSVKSIQSKSRNLKLLKNKDYIKNINKIRTENRWSDKLWSKDNLDFLVQNINNMSNDELAKSLNRSKNSIVSMCTSLNVKRDKKYNGEYIEKECLKYITKNDLKLNNPNLLAWLYRKGKLSDYSKHMLNISYSTPQLILKYIMSKITNSKLSYNDRIAIKPYEIDIYFPEHKLGIEYDGEYYHKNENDFKLKMCLSKDIKLIIIHEKNLNRKYFEKYEQNIKNQLIENLDTINKYLKLNISKNGIFNLSIDKNEVFKGLFDINKLKEICDKYTDYSMFVKYQKSSYSKLYYLGLLREFTKHMRVKNINEVYV